MGKRAKAAIEALSPMKTRAIWVPWPVGMKEPERLLDDLATWTDINTVIVGDSHPTVDQREALVLPSARGFDDLRVEVVTAADLDSMFSFVDLAKSKGFKVSCNVTPINPRTRDRLSLGCVDVTGERADDTFLWGCPNNPEVARYAETVIHELVSTWPAMDLLDLNHLEYTHWCDTGLSELFVCFCGWCRQKAEDAGLDFEHMQREVASAYDALVAAHHSGSNPPSRISMNEALSYLVERPLLAAWLNFRMSSMSDFIKRVTQAGRDASRERKLDLRIGISFQMASIARFVGTDIGELYGLVDWIAPKFPDYIPGEVVPRIAAELASRSGRWSAAELMPVIRQLMDLDPGPEEYVPFAADLVQEQGLLYSNAFDVSIIDGLMKHLEAFSGRLPMYPWIWLHYRDLDDLRGKVNALDAHGFDGYFLWCWEQDLTTERLIAAKGVL